MIERARMPAQEPIATRADAADEPDPAALWRWVASGVRPWLGWILIAAGGLLMLLGYFGVSRESIPAKQIPYLVSGGIGGVFLAVVGAFFLGTQELRNDSGRLDRLERMVEELHQALLTRPAAPPVPAAEHAASSPDDGRSARRSGRVLAVDGGELFHRADCAVVIGKDSRELTPSAAERRGLRACPACLPASAAAGG